MTWCGMTEEDQRRLAEALAKRNQKSRANESQMGGS